jgi:phosphoenolpyruvate carboxykinase (GTP)
VPHSADIDAEGLPIDKKTVEGLLSVDREVWKGEAEQVGTFHQEFGAKLPAELPKQLDALKKRLG